MAKDKSVKNATKSKAPPAPIGTAERPVPVDAADIADTAPSQPAPRTRRGFFWFLRGHGGGGGGEKSKSSKKITLAAVNQSEVASADSSSNNNKVGRSASFTEPSTSKQETRPKVKRHLSVSRSGKMKELRKRSSLAEFNKRFENQAPV